MTHEQLELVSTLFSTLLLINLPYLIFVVILQEDTSKIRTEKLYHVIWYHYLLTICCGTIYAY